MQALHDSVVRASNEAPVVDSPVSTNQTSPSRRVLRPLTDVDIRNAKSDGRRRRMYDTGGLYLEIFPNGSKLWRWKYRFLRKEKRLVLGKYPEVGLKDARDKRNEARKLLNDGIDPSAHKQAVKAARLARAENSFEAVAREWFKEMMSDKAESHRVKVIARLEKNVLGYHIRAEKLSPHNFGIPQIRERVYIVGSTEPLAIGIMPCGTLALI